MDECEKILTELRNKDEASPFNEPVDWQGMKLLDYPEIIKKPMDLGTIQKKLQEGKYPSPEKFAADVRLVWKNAMTYNRADSDIYHTAEKLGKLFEKRFNKLKTKPASSKKKSEAKEGGVVNQASKTDKLLFSRLVNSLSSDQLGQVVATIQHRCPNALNEEDDDVLEIEINNLDAVTLGALNTFAQSMITESAKKKPPQKKEETAQ
eukprot:TRINITY_DN902_c0_g1_i2.p1 TRINITY_DN902_c0_g1~~TRINITY_DN902_c0_g1_i2.p1  ORF type:complete len:215 (-),score=51.29 TRINITY_DN902_c0_g1_i2:319-939(-)